MSTEALADGLGLELAEVAASSVPEEQAVRIRRLAKPAATRPMRFIG
jgi:hypothetical protein